MAKLLYTLRALRLIDEATDFSLQNFGYDRTLQYVADMEAEFLKIARDHKEIAAKRNRHALTGNTELSLHPVGKYYAVFKAVIIDGQETVIILDMPGQEQDLPSIIYRNMLIFQREIAQLAANLGRKPQNPTQDDR